MGTWAVHFVGVLTVVATVWGLYHVRNIPRLGVRFAVFMGIFLLAYIVLEGWYMPRILPVRQGGNRIEITIAFAVLGVFYWFASGGIPGGRKKPPDE